MSQTLSLANRNKIQKLEAKQNNLVEQIKGIKARPVRSSSGTRNKSDKITDLKQRFDVLKVHAELQGITPPAEVSKLLAKHYDAKELGISLLGTIVKETIHKGKVAEIDKELSQKNIVKLINILLQKVKPSATPYTEKDVDKFIKDYGKNLTNVRDDIKMAIKKRDAGQPFEGLPELAYTEADKGESKELATEMVAGAVIEKIKRAEEKAVDKELTKTKSKFDREAKKHNYTQAQALAVVAKDIRDESYYPEKANIPKLTKISEIVDTTPKPAHIKQEAVNKMAGANEVLKKLDHQVQQHKVSLNYNKPTDLTDVLKKLGY